MASIAWLLPVYTVICFEFLVYNQVLFVLLIRRVKKLLAKLFYKTI